MSLGAPLLFTEAGEQIRFRTRKHFALLIRLAVESGRKFTRDYLMDLLWPDVPAPRARHSLAQALTVVKAKVGPEHLIVQRTSIALVPGVVDADVRRLDSCEAEIQGPFLEGFEWPGAGAGARVGAARAAVRSGDVDRPRAGVFPSVRRVARGAAAHAAHRGDGGRSRRGEDDVDQRVRLDVSNGRRSHRARPGVRRG